MIYIVEDDLNIRQMESYALKNSGYLTEEFDDGVSFFAACEKKLPDLILLDIMLPGDDGLKILQTLKANQRTRFIPVILITAKTTELDTVKGLDLGADDYIASRSASWNSSPGSKPSCGEPAPPEMACWLWDRDPDGRPETAGLVRKQVV